jgi:hypothetical protein
MDGMLARDWYQSKNGNIEYHKGNSEIKGLTNLGSSTNIIAGTGQGLKLNANGTATDINSGKLYGSNKKIVVNSSTGLTVTTVKPSKTTVEGKDNIAFSDGGQSRASDSQRVRNLSMIDFGGGLTALLAILVFDSPKSTAKPNGLGTNGGKPTIGDKAEDAINATDNASSATKEIVEVTKEPTVNDSVIGYSRGEDDKIDLKSRTSRLKTEDEKKQ